MLPRAIYFDTNALNQLTHGEANVDFVELRQISQGRSGLFVADVVVRELIQLRFREALEQINKIKQGSQRLGHLLFRKSFGYERAESVEETISKEIINFLHSLEIDTIPTPNIPLETLIEMAIKKHPPFEEKREKGFRDSVILFSILEHVQNNQFLSAMLVTGDQKFSQAIIDRFEMCSLDIVTAKNISEAVEKYKAELENQITSLAEEKSRNIKAFLQTQFQAISDYIYEHAEISESFLRGGMFNIRDDMVGTTIKKIVAFRPKEVSKVHLGLLLKPQNEAVPAGFRGITFTVATDIDLIVNQLTLADLFPPKISVTALEEFEKAKYVSAPPLSDEQMTVNRELTLQAQIKEENETYSDLQILQVLSY